MLLRVDDLPLPRLRIPSVLELQRPGLRALRRPLLLLLHLLSLLLLLLPSLVLRLLRLRLGLRLRLLVVPRHAAVRMMRMRRDGPSRHPALLSAPLLLRARRGVGRPPAVASSPSSSVVHGGHLERQQRAFPPPLPPDFDPFLEPPLRKALFVVHDRHERHAELLHFQVRRVVGRVAGEEEHGRVRDLGLFSSSSFVSGNGNVESAVVTRRKSEPARRCERREVVRSSDVSESSIRG